MRPSEPKKLRGKALYIHLLDQQRKWIEQCEAGISYIGPNGRATCRADLAELKRLEDHIGSYK